MNKRLISIVGVGAFLTAFFTAIPGSQGIKTLEGDGYITLYNLHLHEAVSVQFRKKNGSFDEEALKLVNYTLRCRKTHRITEISADLLELVDQIQDHFGGGAVQVISAYRSPELNESLRHQGRGVAKRSLHMAGMAMDIRLPGISTRDLRKYATALKGGGVGFYPSSEFIHVDVGRIRYW